MTIITVKTGGITADAITAAKIADNAVVTAAINADAVTDAKIADDVVGTEHLTANEVDTAALAADAVTAAQIADDAISEEHLDVTSITGHGALTSVANDDLVLISDTSASAALKKMTVANLVANAGGGKIGQVVSATKTDTFANTSDTMADITGLTVAITPSASNSKVLVTVNFNASIDLDDRFCVFQLVRGSTAISIGAAAGNRTVGSVAHVRVAGDGAANAIAEYTINFLDSPSTTSETTYKMQGLAQSDNNPGFRINMSGADANAVHGFRLASTITVMEVLA